MPYLYNMFELEMSPVEEEKFNENILNAFQDNHPWDEIEATAFIFPRIILKPLCPRGQIWLQQPSQKNSAPETGDM